ncbi:fibronectin type III domain-containing protein 5 isoform X1 [Solea solea]|uniref:fibronectin type III domain-containing protein 5 isoform X1 n=2 Tax=Solea solea TaxID=90069 RepID=UPI00272CEE1C|nr:fibronectin type III domain-containing protein 5 isoform X1 [Solea solea]XP_058470795.1 fibronectin type III domain-containing protein 5 isoform X1 [Solea solea]
MHLWWLRKNKQDGNIKEEVALHVASLCVRGGPVENKTAAVRDLNITACVTQLVIMCVADSLSPPVNVTIKALKANSAVVTWDIPEGDSVIGFAITQQKKDVRMLRFIQEVNTTTRSCALWDLEEETDYIVRVQSISMSGTSPPSELLRFRTPKEAETQASKSKDEVTMEEVGQSTQLRAGELIIIVAVLIMWAGVIALFCRQYDIIKDNEPNNNKDKAKNSSECSTPEHPTGGLLRSKFSNNNNNKMPSVNIIEV